MATIAENLNEVIKCKNDMKQALINKESEPTGGLNTYATAIDNIKRYKGSEFDWNILNYNYDNKKIANNYLQMSIDEVKIIYDEWNPNNTSAENYLSWKHIFYAPKIDTRNVTNMRKMFKDCKYLIYVPQLDTSNVTNMEWMFSGCKNLTIIPQLDTSNVTNMGQIFSYCDSLTTIPQLDTSNVTNMWYMFGGCDSLITIPQLNTSNVTDMSGMFKWCKNLTTVPELNINKVTNMSEMFWGCTSLKEVRFSGGTYQSNIDCTGMFEWVSTTGKAYFKSGGWYGYIREALPSTWTYEYYD